MPRRTDDLTPLLNEKRRIYENALDNLEHGRPLKRVSRYPSPLSTFLILSLCWLSFVAYNLFFGVPLDGDHHVPGVLTVEERAIKILEENPLIDGHNDLMILIRFLYKNQIYGENFTEKFEKGGMLGHVDLPRLDQGKVGGAFWSAFMPCPSNASDFSDEAYAPSRSLPAHPLSLESGLVGCYFKMFAFSSASLRGFKVTINLLGRLRDPFRLHALHSFAVGLSDLGILSACQTNNPPSRQSNPPTTRPPPPPPRPLPPLLHPHPLRRLRPPRLRLQPPHLPPRNRRPAPDRQLPQHPAPLSPAGRALRNPNLELPQRVRRRRARDRWRHEGDCGCGTAVGWSFAAGEEGGQGDESVGDVG